MKALRIAFYVLFVIALVSTGLSLLGWMQQMRNPDFAEYRPSAIDSYIHEPGWARGWFAGLTIFGSNLFAFLALFIALGMVLKGKKQFLLHAFTMELCIVLVSLYLITRPSFREHQRESFRDSSQSLIESAVWKIMFEMEQKEMEPLLKAVQEDIKKNEKMTPAEVSAAQRRTNQLRAMIQSKTLNIPELSSSPNATDDLLGFKLGHYPRDASRPPVSVTRIGL